MPRIDVVNDCGGVKDRFCMVCQEEPVGISVQGESLFVTVSDASLETLVTSMKEAFRSGVKNVTVNITRNREDTERGMDNVVYDGDQGFPSYISTSTRRTECMIFESKE